MSRSLVHKRSQLISGVAVETKVPNKDTFAEHCANSICWISICCNVKKYQSGESKMHVIQLMQLSICRSIELIFNLRPQSGFFFF